MLSDLTLTGAPIWVDLGTTDIDGAAAFYKGVFGWDFEKGGEEVGGYGTFQIDGKAAAGGMAVTPEMGATGGPSWSLYFCTPDADATAKKVEQAGGRTLFEPMDVLDYGRMAGFADAAGVAFSVWQPGQNKGLDVVNVPGGLIWTELYTPDIEAGAAFYDAVFGWKTIAQPFEGGSYTMVYPGGGTADDMFGGLWPLDQDPVEQEAGVYWMPYFQVADIDAVVEKARTTGGTVRAERMDLAGVGAFAKLADPHGAKFALMQPEPQQG
ncbi:MULTISPECIES: VOC family protein [Streptomyces]|uniref:Hydroxylase n=1 Tax=Streptomyces lasiicapitis TaxID=1923961 RepID=A0ABQ2LJE9_9ACTN|nr:MULTISPECIES: VOC family protein [Streptomyces]QIB42506.1 VOC family protein [Streptomyces aureoverticillatus]GGO36974.1 hydroxylase [Streptomyces lasiicapitis]